MADLKDYKFSEDHEWVKLEGNIATIGITDYAQKELGDVVFVELPTIGDSFAKGDNCANIESVKAVSDIYCPVSGEIVEVNEELDSAPELINQEPYEKGWIFKIKINDKNELDSLKNHEEYEEYLKGL